MGICHIREHRGHRPGLRNPHLWIVVVLFAFLTVWHFTELLAGVGAGKVRCEIADVFPLEDATRAIELSRTGHVVGKIVIRVA